MRAEFFRSGTKSAKRQREPKKSRRAITQAAGGDAVADQVTL